MSRHVKLFDFVYILVMYLKLDKRDGRASCFSFFTTRQRSWRKAVFSVISVCPQGVPCDHHHDALDLTIQRTPQPPVDRASLYRDPPAPPYPRNGTSLYRDPQPCPPNIWPHSTGTVWPSDMFNLDFTVQGHQDMFKFVHYEVCMFDKWAAPEYFLIMYSFTKFLKTTCETLTTWFCLHSSYLKVDNNIMEWKEFHTCWLMCNN